MVAAGAWSVSSACKDDKASGASASVASAHGACTADMAAKCTAAQAAACKDKAAMSAAAKNCPYHSGASAVTADVGMCQHAKTSASAANGCNMHGAAAMTAGNDKGSCNHGASAGMSDHCLRGASAHAGCSGNTSATAGNCMGLGMASASYSRSVHSDCDACADMAQCAQELGGLGATAQIVPLKNGVMFVYTVENAGKVRAVQTALARRSERMARMTTAGESAHLCNECKSMRGAAASGKLEREVVNIEGGALTLMTSNDPRIVAKLHAMAGVPVAARIKG